MSSMVNCSEREVASVSFKVDFDKFRVLGHTKCSRREEKMQRKMPSKPEMDVRREVKRVV